MAERTRPVALITGGTRGIGRAIADVLAVDHRLLIGGRDRERCAEVAAGYPDAVGWPADVTDGAAVSAAVEGIERLDVLVHSAGVAEGTVVSDTPREAWKRVLETNVVAVADLTRLLLPALRAAGGQVVLINSGASMRPVPGSSVYAASKAALTSFGDALREEERGRVRVCSVHPGRVDTDMQIELQARKGRAYDPSEHLRPESIAAAVRLAVDASPEAMLESMVIRPAFG
ncbi:SDR family oxidoreductase [Granulicoccus sp. GXG6511]|uniref:SDR family oxidoreductase n=1 Tax=Granulicoccus sp. GXG6511 TaxID=3381351 RepID=UPI003D7DC500